MHNLFFYLSYEKINRTDLFLIYFYLCFAKQLANQILVESQMKDEKITSLNKTVEDLNGKFAASLKEEKEKHQKAAKELSDEIVVQRMAVKSFEEQNVSLSAALDAEKASTPL